MNRPSRTSGGSREGRATAPRTDGQSPGGYFVAYRFTDEVHRFCRPRLGPARVEVELLNIPPLRVFQWKKGSRPVFRT